jgi:hypothetical protein
MPPTQTPAGRPVSRQPVHDHRRQSTFPGTLGPDAYYLILPLPSDEEFLSRFGDTIDDRIAEILDELLTERSSASRHRRLPYLLCAVSLILAALAVSILLRHTPIAWLIWPATAVISIAMAWTSSAPAPYGRARL